MIYYDRVANEESIVKKLLEVQYTWHLCATINVYCIVRWVVVAVDVAVTLLTAQNRKMIYLFLSSYYPFVRTFKIQEDNKQLMRSSTELLKNAKCSHLEDRMFIEKTLDKHFDSREDAVDTIKVSCCCCCCVTCDACLS